MPCRMTEFYIVNAAIVLTTFRLNLGPSEIQTSVVY